MKGASGEGADFIQNRRGKKCKVTRALVILVQCVTVASLSIVNVNNPHILILFACNVRLQMMCRV